MVAKKIILNYSNSFLSVVRTGSSYRLGLLI